MQFEEAKSHGFADPDITLREYSGQIVWSGAFEVLLNGHKNLT